MSLFLLILGVATLPGIPSHDTDDLDAIIDFCIEKTENFNLGEDIYIKKLERTITEPILSPPLIQELELIVNDKETRQRVFECITDTWNGSYDALKENENYKNLAHQCESKQYRPDCDSDYPYRTFDGTCNNLENPTWGSVLSCAKRWLPAAYEGAAGMRKSVYGNKDLPSPRKVSAEYHTDQSDDDWEASMLWFFFGQFIMHDVTNTPRTFVKGQPLECCDNPGGSIEHPQCAPINDSYYSKVGLRCQGFVRAAMCDTCSVGPRSQMDASSAWIDLSQVYDLLKEPAKKLRKLDGSGQLKIKETKFGGILPMNEADPARCWKKNKCAFEDHEGGNYTQGERIEGYCYKTGDNRQNQHGILMSLHTLFVGEHNRIAAILKEMNPCWDEEKLYQEARKILIAVYQVMVFKEFLPYLVNPYFMSKYKLRITDSYEYDPSVDPTIYAEFSGAAARMHSMAGNIVTSDEVDGPGSSELRNLFQCGSFIHDGKMKDLFLGLAGRQTQKNDKHMAKALSQYLYRELRAKHGFDLTAVNILRGRDIGLRPYVDYMKYWFNATINSCVDLQPYMDPVNCRELEHIYGDVRNIDLWTVLVSEYKEPGMPISKLAAIIISKQFQAWKLGDRFYYKNGHFTPEQVETLENATFSKFICDNTGMEPHHLIQANSMEIPTSARIKVPCSSLPIVDLGKWKDSECSNEGHCESSSGNDSPYQCESSSQSENQCERESSSQSENPHESESSCQIENPHESSCQSESPYKN